MIEQDINIEEITIEIVDSKIHRTIGCMLVANKKGRISLSEEAKAKLNVVKGDYLIFGRVGAANFIAKRPEGKNLHGFVVHKPKKSIVHYVSSLSLEYIPIGKYNFQDAIFKDNFVWHPLIPID